jgi:hypothetical protein
MVVERFEGSPRSWGFIGGGSWHIDFYRGSKRVREKVGPSKGEAKLALSVRKGQVALGKFDLLPKSEFLFFARLRIVMKG